MEAAELTSSSPQGLDYGPPTLAPYPFGPDAIDVGVIGVQMTGNFDITP